MPVALPPVESPNPNRCRRSGRSWGRQKVVHGEGTSKKHVCIGNPSPVVVTSKPGRVVMTGTREVNEGFSVISDDYGETWGPAVYQPSLNAPRQHGSGAPPAAYGQNISNWDFCKTVIFLDLLRCHSC